MQAGATDLGLVSAMPSGPGVIGEALIAEIAAAVPPMIGTYLLTSQRDISAIVAQVRRTGVRGVQICDRLDGALYPTLRHALPGVQLMPVIHVTGSEVLPEAKALAPLVDGLLLDTGNPSASVKVLGGTGRTHDWAVSRQIRDAIGVPVFLAGGLRAVNVAAAIRQVQPTGVDICTGVRTEGRLDADKLARFVEAVRQARW
jgi:phosphoribosylanthranilate isomerase